MNIDYAKLAIGLLRSNASDLIAVEQALGIGKAASLIDPIEKIVSSYASGGIKSVLQSAGAEVGTAISDVAPDIAKVAPNLANIAETVSAIEPSLNIPKEVVAVLRSAGADLQAVIQAAAPVISKVAPNLSNMLSAAKPAG